MKASEMIQGGCYWTEVAFNRKLYFAVESIKRNTIPGVGIERDETIVRHIGRSNNERRK